MDVINSTQPRALTTLAAPTPDTRCRAVYSYYLSKSGQTSGLGLVKAMNPSIDSVGASTAGNSATLILNLQQCFTTLIMSPDPSAVTCVVGPRGPVLTLQVLVNGIVSHHLLGTTPPVRV